MDCGGMMDQLSFYIDGALAEGDRLTVERHLAECAECRSELASLKMLVAAARDIEAVDPPASLRSRIAAATTDRQQVEHGWAGARLRLRELFSARSVQWAAGLACAAAAVTVLYVSLTPGVEPSSRVAFTPKSSAPMSASVVATPPAPVRIALATVASAGLREVRSPAPARRLRPARAAVNATLGSALAPKPKAKPKAGDESRPERAPAGESGDEMAAVDDTTPAESVAASDLVEPAPEIYDTPKDQPGLIKVASSPVNKDDTEEWLKKMKAEASMRPRDHGSNGMSLINARF